MDTGQITRAKKLLHIFPKSGSKTRRDLMNIFDKIVDVLSGPESCEKTNDIISQMIKDSLG